MTANLDDFGRGELHQAAMDNDVEKALAAIAAGADPDHKDIYDSAPLHAAVQSNAVDVVKVLLEAGAMVDLPASNGHTSLFFAVVSSNGNGEIHSYPVNIGDRSPLRPGKRFQRRERRQGL